MPLILFTSPKGGVGKTTLAAHVAAMFAGRGRHVVALDLDPQNALRLHLGLSLREEAGFLARLKPGANWRASLIETACGVDLLPFGASDPVATLKLNCALSADPALLTIPVREILARPETILIVDSPPGPSPAVSALAGLADLLIMVLLADAGSACLIPQVLSGPGPGRGTIGSRMPDRGAVVLNQVDLDRPLSTAVMDSAARLLGPRLLGAVCRDDALAEALAERRLQGEGEGGAAEDLSLLVDAISDWIRPASSAAERPAFPALAEWGLV